MNFNRWALVAGLLPASALAGLWAIVPARAAPPAATIQPAGAVLPAREKVATPAAAAREMDVLLRGELPAHGATASAAPPVNDELYLRRVMLDLVGDIPTAEELTAFALDPSSDKRARLVERLLADPRYGTNWARYWRDVIFYRRTDERALVSAPAAEDWLQAEFRRNAPWSEIATELITATGNIHEEGRTALISAQQARPEDVTSEVARIFLGVQIQCAQCHDHPTDRWKREQFHEMAAFFPRVALRPLEMNNLRSLTIVSDDVPFRLGRRNNDNRFRGTPEHFMPDLKNSEAEGTRMTPALFATGQKFDLGAKDLDRRATVATWITASSNPWFAKAYVNRMWAELVGEGFYEPVDDLGPDRACSAPRTLEYLASGFTASGYDCQWLFRVICATELYQRESRPRRQGDETPFAANVSQRLRGDQVFNSLLAVLAVDETTLARSRGYTPGGGPREMLRNPRFLFNFVFGYDPSEPRSDVAGSVPQALALMNSPQLGGAITAARQDVGLGKLLATVSEDRAVTQELYLRVLAREPTAAETKTCLAYVSQVNNRAEAFEDLTWALINSAEFLHRR